MGHVRLVVQADDLGMCRAVNDGIEHAVVDGIVTQTSVMAATPWFVEGAEMARRVGVITGLHATFTCEWDYLRWAPLSTGSSLRLDDGTMWRTVDDAAERIDESEGVAELQAQARRAAACGLQLTYVDTHMGLSVASAYAEICDELDVRYIYPGVDPHYSFDSISVLSMASAKDLSARTSRFIEWLERLDDGVHFVLAHPGTPGPELRALCDPDSPIAVWAETWRAADLATLTDPAVRSTIERLNIELTTIVDL